VVKHLPSKNKALSSTLSTEKRKKKSKASFGWRAHYVSKTDFCAIFVFSMLWKDLVAAVYQMMNEVFLIMTELINQDFTTEALLSCPYGSSIGRVWVPAWASI
jgi:hypothetical protein